jgi:cardiolipin synthase A/B
MGISQQLHAWLHPPPPLATGWDQEAVWTDGDAWFRDLLQDLAGAQHSVWMETYILAPDALGARVLAALVAAQARGCEVHLLVDGVGSAAWLQEQRHATVGPPLRVWNPLPWAAARRATLLRRWRWLATVNRRDHRKVCIIDGERAWVGSLNVDGCHTAELSGPTRWRDTGARVAGPGIAALEAAFAHAWRRAWPMVHGRVRLPLRRGPRPPADGCVAVRLNHTVSDRREMYRDLLARLKAAQRRIWISNAYVVPRGSLLRALLAAAKRGVDVRLVAPANSDIPFMPWVGATFADALLLRGVRVFAYLPRMLHAKTMLIDGYALVGSHNLNARSFMHDLEAEVVLTHPASIATLESAYAADCAQSRELHPPAMAGLPWWQRAVGRTMLLAKRFI